MKICIYSPESFKYFVDTPDPYYGGAERRAANVARTLVNNHNIEVTLLCADYGQADRVRVDGVELVKVPGLLRFTPNSLKEFAKLKLREWEIRLKDKWGKTLRGQAGWAVAASRWMPFAEVDADWYFSFGINTGSSDLAEFCDVAKKRHILFLYSDLDLLEGEGFKKRMEEYPPADWPLRREFMIRSATVIVQNRRQRELVEKMFGKTCYLLPNPEPISRSGKEHGTDGAFALWIGKSDENKNPDLFLQLAHRYSSEKFVMVLNVREGELYGKILSSLPRNVELYMSTTPDETENLFANAKLLVNTSLMEGFPNTFLQAGKNGVPVLSYRVDPDGILEKAGCGICAGGREDRFFEGFERLVSDKEFYTNTSDKIRDYVWELHNAEVVVRRLLKYLQDKGDV